MKTNTVTAVGIAERSAGDSLMLWPLGERTAQSFNVQEVPTDKAYLSCENLQVAHDRDGTASAPFKANSTPDEAAPLREKM